MSDIGALATALDDYKRRKRQKDRKAASGCFVALAKVAFVAASVFWWLPFATMLAFGVVHSRFTAVPAFGFWEVFVIGIGVRYLLGRTDTQKAGKDRDKEA